MEEEKQGFYEQAKEFYQKALKEEDFFNQRRLLGNTMQFLVRAYHKREIDTLEGLPESGINVLTFDKRETSELIKKLYAFFPSEEDFPSFPEDEEEPRYTC